MIDAKLDSFFNGDEWTYILTVKVDGVMVKQDVFKDIYKAKSAQRKWWVIKG